MKHMIQIFDQLYPNAVAEFMFDQSSAHGAFAKNALHVKGINVQPGGKQHRMHDTFIPNNNLNPSLHGIHQMMVFPEDLPPSHPDYKFCGQPKGMLHILEEHGLLTMLEDANNGKVVGECAMCKLLHKALDLLLCETQAVADEPLEEASNVILDSKCTDCCMRKMIASQQDFKSKKPLIQLICKEVGHECWFLPKFHCELNPIEIYWGWVKAHMCTWKHHHLILVTYGHLIAMITGFHVSADGTFCTACCLVPELLNDCLVKTVCGFFHKCWRYMDAYRYDYILSIHTL